MTISAITLRIGELNQPVITDYELGLILFELYTNKKISDEEPVVDYVAKMVDVGVITKHKEFPKGKVFAITGKKGYDAGDVVCAIDPFAYISHLSALSFHGLTDRIPHTLYVSTPPHSQWNRFAAEKMKKDLGGGLRQHSKYGLPKLKKIEIKKANGKPIIEYKSAHQGAFKTVENRKIRVSTIGRTFLDAVREPEYCGGMGHVIEVFEEFGKLHSKTIIDTAGRSGKEIEKARVGYLLEEYCGVRDGRLDEWAEETVRGGSKKLDPSNEYSSEYSAKWNISINV